MTAEIIVFNAEAIALAADSAVTSQYGTVSKISPSANKLFALSLVHPVGIMVYGNALFMDLPWETIIKAYRSMYLPKFGFGKLEDYAENFISYLKFDNIEFPELADSRYLKRFANTLLDNVIEKVLKRFREEARKDSDLDTVLTRIMKQEISTQFDKYNRGPEIIPLKISRELFERKKWLSSLIDEKFTTINLSRTDKQKLRQITVDSFSRSILNDLSSGIVVAGFGEKEFTPSIVAYELEGIVRYKENKAYIEILKYNIDVDKSHRGLEKKAGIVPFAQDDMTAVFVLGIHPLLDEAISRILKRLCDDFAEKIVKQLENKFQQSELISVRKSLLQYGDELAKHFTDGIETIQKSQFVDPIVRALSRLSKDDLASLAEALVHLTSLKRKVSDYPETVSDPMDVAVISKGDGLIWIKRKHYFSSELNPNFFIKRSREVTDGNER